VVESIGLGRLSSKAHGLAAGKGGPPCADSLANDPQAMRTFLMGRFTSPALVA